MEEIKFNMSAIEKTFARYKKNDIFDGVVIQKKDDGVIFNIGGKSDAFIKKEDFETFDNIKVGDRFKVVVLGEKTEDGMILVSKSIADEIIVGSQNAEKLRIGSEVSFYATGINNNSITSKLGQYEIIVPNDQIDIQIHNIKSYLNKQHTGIVIEINKKEKLIVVSIKMLKQQIKETAENLFWNSVYINKVVKGKITKIMPYGAFVNVDGVDCFMHISDISYTHIDNIFDVLNVGDAKTFRIIKIDKINKKVSVGLKQLSENPKTALVRSMAIGDVHNGKVQKILSFGAIIKLDNGMDGLLHISDATEKNDKRIYEIVKLDENVKVEIKSIDNERDRIGLKLVK